MKRLSPLAAFAKTGRMGKRLGLSPRRWQKGMEKLRGDRLLGRLFAASRAELGEIGERIVVPHLANLTGCPIRDTIMNRRLHRKAVRFYRQSACPMPLASFASPANSGFQSYLAGAKSRSKLAWSASSRPWGSMIKAIPPGLIHVIRLPRAKTNLSSGWLSRSRK